MTGHPTSAGIAASQEAERGSSLCRRPAAGAMKDDTRLEKAVRDITILGSGPAGLTAAIYAARANLKPLVVEGISAGGQLMLTSDVENYPGFPKGTLGPELMMEFRQQAERFGTEFLVGDATKVELTAQPIRVHVENQVVETRTLILATGATAKWLGLQSEMTLNGRGVSACATCDGFFFRDRNVVVVGGGDTALEEALYLTRMVKQASVIHRRDQLRGSKIMQERAFKNEKIGFIWDTVIDDILDPAAGKVTGVRLRNVKTGALTEMPTDGVFIAIGHQPNSKLFEGQLDMDERGYVICKPNSTYTNLPGVFACGDLMDSVYRQAVTAAGTGCMAAIDAERWLEAQSGH
jgi:thioredoxin reductase (NADPH)